MNQKTKYYYIIKNIILWFVIVLLISVLTKIAAIYSYVNEDVFHALSIVLKTMNTLFIIGLCLGVLYLIIQAIGYFNSVFYSTYKINIFEAFYKGILDMYQVYDKIRRFTNTKDVQIDFLKNILYFSDKNVYYSMLFLDIFGTIEGTMDSEFWSVGRGAKKQYGRKVFKTKIRFENPFRINAEFIEKLQLATGKTYRSYVVISGFYKTKSKISNILTPYEIISLGE